MAITSLIGSFLVIVRVNPNCQPAPRKCQPAASAYAAARSPRSPALSPSAAMAPISLGRTSLTTARLSPLMESL